MFEIWLQSCWLRLTLPAAGLLLMHGHVAALCTALEAWSCPAKAYGACSEVPTGSSLKLALSPLCRRKRKDDLG